MKDKKINISNTFGKFQGYRLLHFHGVFQSHLFDCGFKREYVNFKGFYLFNELTYIE